MKLTFRKIDRREPETRRYEVRADGKVVGQIALMPLGYWTGIGEHNDIKTETRYEGAHWIARRGREGADR